MPLYWFIFDYLEYIKIKLTAEYINGFINIENVNMYQISIIIDGS